MTINLTFSEPFYEDLPPEEKSSEELVFLVLQHAAGDINNIKKYNESEIDRCVRKLIEKGMVRGTILGDHCSWSRLTPNGILYYEIIKKKGFNE